MHICSCIHPTAHAITYISGQTHTQTLSSISISRQDDKYWHLEMVKAIVMFSQHDQSAYTRQQGSVAVTGVADVLQQCRNNRYHQLLLRKSAGQLSHKQQSLSLFFLAARIWHFLLSWYSYIPEYYILWSFTEIIKLLQWFIASSLPQSLWQLMHSKLHSRHPVSTSQKYVRHKKYVNMDCSTTHFSPVPVRACYCHWPPAWSPDHKDSVALTANTHNLLWYL